MTEHKLQPSIRTHVLAWPSLLFCVFLLCIELKTHVANTEVSLVPAYSDRTTSSRFSNPWLWAYVVSSNHFYSVICTAKHNKTKKAHNEKNKIKLKGENMNVIVTNQHHPSLSFTLLPIHESDCNPGLEQTAHHSVHPQPSACAPHPEPCCKALITPFQTGWTSPRPGPRSEINATPPLQRGDRLAPGCSWCTVVCANGRDAEEADVENDRPRARLCGWELVQTYRSRFTNCSAAWTTFCPPAHQL